MFTAARLVSIAFVLSACGSSTDAAPTAPTAPPPPPSHFPMIPARLMPVYIRDLAFGSTTLAEARTAFPEPQSLVNVLADTQYGGFDYWGDRHYTQMLITAPDGTSPFGPMMLDRIRLAFATLPNRPEPVLVGAKFDQNPAAPTSVCNDIMSEYDRSEGQPCYPPLTRSRDAMGFTFCGGDWTGQLPMYVKCASPDLVIAVALDSVSPTLPNPLPAPPANFQPPGSAHAEPPPPPVAVPAAPPAPPPPPVVTEVPFPTEPGVDTLANLGTSCQSGTHTWSNVSLHDTTNQGPMLTATGTCEITCTHCTLNSAAGQVIRVAGHAKVTFIDSTLQADTFTPIAVADHGELTLQGSHVLNHANFADIVQQAVFNTSNTTYQSGTVRRIGNPTINDRGGNTGLAL